jgi:hypothetical protein
MTDPLEIAALFGDDMMASDMQRTSKGDVSEMSTALEGPGGPFDDLIPAKVETPEGDMPAALSPGEFVLSEPITAFLGDGDVALGAGLLDIMQSNEEALNEVKSVLQKYKP